MKLRALGAGNPFCRWPLIPSCWLLQTEGSNVLIGCPVQAAARLEVLGLSPDKIDMIIPLGYSVAHAGGLDELGHIFRHSAQKPYLACPENLMSKILGRIEYPRSFQPRAAKQVGFKEEHITETMVFVDNFSGSYGFRLEAAGIFCSGSAKVNESWLHRQMDCNILLHEDRPELIDLPIYLQKKVWIYGYSKLSDGSDPIPMLFLPQGTFVYDSDRRDKTITKERYIRENSKRIVGNEESK